MYLNGMNAETIAKMIEATKGLNRQLMDAEQLQKATVAIAGGLTGYNLEPKVKVLMTMPWIAGPFRQRMPRRVLGGTGNNFKTITAAARASAFKATEGTKAGTWSFTPGTGSVTFAEYGRGGDITSAAISAGRNFGTDPMDFLETMTLASALQEEEACILGGATTDFGVGPTPTVVAAASGGHLADATYYVAIAQLSIPACIRCSAIARPARGGNIFDFTTPPTVDTTEGCGLTGSEGSGVVTGGGGAGKITVTWLPPANEASAAYAIFIGVATGKGNIKLQGIVTQSTVIVDRTNTTGVTATAWETGGDTSGDSPFKGIYQLAVDSASGAYVKEMGGGVAGGGTLSAASGAGIPEIDDMLSAIYDRMHIEPDRLLMGWPEAYAIDSKLAAVTNDRIHLNVSLNPNQTDPGISLPRFSTYRTPRGKHIPIEENPNIPGGMILALTDAVPMPGAGVPACFEMLFSHDFVRLDYAMTAPKTEMETRAYGALAGYAMILQGVMFNIRNA